MSENNNNTDNTSKKYASYMASKRNFGERTEGIYSNFQKNQKQIISLTEKMRREAGLDR